MGFLCRIRMTSTSMMTSQIRLMQHRKVRNAAVHLKKYSPKLSCSLGECFQVESNPPPAASQLCNPPATVIGLNNVSGGEPRSHKAPGRGASNRTRGWLQRRRGICDCLISDGTIGIQLGMRRITSYRFLCIVEALPQTTWEEYSTTVSDTPAQLCCWHGLLDTVFFPASRRWTCREGGVFHECNLLIFSQFVSFLFCSLFFLIRPPFSPPQV